MLLRLATDDRIGVSLHDLRTHHTILDILDLHEMLDYRDQVDNARAEAAMKGW